MIRLLTTVPLTLALLLAAPASARDIDGAKKYLADATAAIAKQQWNDADTALRLADSELDGVDATARTTIATQIATARKQLQDAQSGGEKAQFLKSVEDVMKDLKDFIGRKDTIEQYNERLEGLLTSENGRKYLTAAEIAEYRKKAAVYKRITDEKEAEASTAEVRNLLAELEQFVPKAVKTLQSPDAGSERDGVLRDAGYKFDRIEKLLAGIPATLAARKDLADRYQKLSDTFNAEAGKQEAAESLKTLKSSWESYKDEYAGWEKETTGPTFDALLKQQSDAMSKFNAPKTVGLIERSNSFIKDIQERNNYKMLIADANVKAFVDGLTKDRDAAREKLAMFAGAIIDQAAKAGKLTKNQRDRVDSLTQYDLRPIEGHPQFDALKKKAADMVARFDGDSGASDSAAEKLLSDLTEAGKAKWPEISAQFKTVDGFDPASASSFKGKLVRFKNVSNRLGWDYQPGNYDFALTINGATVAGKFDPAIKAQLDSIKQSVGGRELPEVETWDVIAEVNGTGKIEKIDRAEGTLTDRSSGDTATVKAQRNITVDAVQVNIVAVNAGYLTAARGVGAVDRTGKVGTPAATPAAGSGAAPASSSGGTSLPASIAGAGSSAAVWIGRFVTLTIGLIAAAAAFMKAGSPKLAAVPHGTETRAQVNAALGANGLAYIGLACAAIGVWWMLRGFIVFGLLVWAVVLAAGLYTALGLLVQRGLIKTSLEAKIRPLGVPIAVACLAVTLIHLLTAGRLIIV